MHRKQRALGVVELAQFDPVLRLVAHALVVGLEDRVCDLQEVGHLTQERLGLVRVGARLLEVLEDVVEGHRGPRRVTAVAVVLDELLEGSLRARAVVGSKARFHDQAQGEGLELLLLSVPFREAAEVLVDLLPGTRGAAASKVVVDVAAIELGGGHRLLALLLADGALDRVDLVDSEVQVALEQGQGAGRVTSAVGAGRDADAGLLGVVAVGADLLEVADGIGPALLTHCLLGVGNVDAGRRVALVDVLEHQVFSLGDLRLEELVAGVRVGDHLDHRPVALGVELGVLEILVVRFEAGLEGHGRLERTSVAAVGVREEVVDAGRVLKLLRGVAGLEAGQDALEGLRGVVVVAVVEVTLGRLDQDVDRDDHAGAAGDLGDQLLGLDLKDVALVVVVDGVRQLEGEGDRALLVAAALDLLLHLLLGGEPAGLARGLAAADVAARIEQGRGTSEQGLVAGDAPGQPELLAAVVEVHRQGTGELALSELGRAVEQASHGDLEEEVALGPLGVADRVLLLFPDFDEQLVDPRVRRPGLVEDALVHVVRVLDVAPQSVNVTHGLVGAQGLGGAFGEEEHHVLEGDDRLIEEVGAVFLGLADGAEHLAPVEHQARGVLELLRRAQVRLSVLDDLDQLSSELHGLLEDVDLALLELVRCLAGQRLEGDVDRLREVDRGGHDPVLGPRAVLRGRVAAQEVLVLLEGLPEELVATGVVALDPGASGVDVAAGQGELLAQIRARVLGAGHVEHFGGQPDHRPLRGEATCEVDVRADLCLGTLGKGLTGQGGHGGQDERRTEKARTQGHG